MKALLLIVALVVALAGCRGGEPGEASATPSPTATVVQATSMPNPSPSATETAVATAIPVATPAAPTPGTTPAATPDRPAPTATPSSPPSATQGAVDVPSNYLTHADQVFGVEVQYPPDWEAVTAVAPPVTMFLRGPEDNQPAMSVSLRYHTNILNSADLVDLLQSGLLERPGFRTLEEEDVALQDGRTGFQVGYQWRDEDGESRGILFATVEKTRNFVVLAEAPSAVFSANLEEIEAVISSIRVVDPAPLGIPREQALTLYETEPLILDPAIAQEVGSIQYISQLFSGLVSFDENLQLQPELAESWVQERSGEGVVYTFKIRDDAVFHDGRKVTAEDVRASWTRAASLAQDSSASVGSSTVGTYLGDIVGLAEVMAGEAEEISGLEVVDETTLRVTIDAPKPYFLSKLAHSVAFIVDQTQTTQAAEEGVPWWVKPNGTGPFRMVEWMLEKAIVMEANERYYGGVPTTRNVVFLLYGGLPSLMFEYGDIDVASVYADELASIEDPANPLSRDLIEIADLGISYVGLNSARPPFDDMMVRQAFLLATDRRTLVESVYGGSVELASGFVPPGMPGFMSEVEDIPFDLEKAKRLLAASTYGETGLPDMVYLAPGSSQPGEGVTALINMWRQNLGVDVEVQLVNPSLYYYGLEFQIAQGNFFNYGWIADYPDPHNFLDVLFRGGVTNNVGGYNNDEVNALLDQAGVEDDAAERGRIYRRVERLLVDDAAAIPLYYSRSQYLVNPNVRGLSLTPFGLLDLRNVVLEDQ